MAPRAFWITFAAACTVLAVMAVGNMLVAVPGVVPGGILDHQAAGNAARVDDIQRAWRSEAPPFAPHVLMVLDFVFIPLAAAAACLGGLSLWRRGVRALGAVAMLAGLAAAGLDLTETGAQAIQLWRDAGDDGLARLAAALVEPKLTAYVVANGALLAGMVLSRQKPAQSA